MSSIVDAVDQVSSGVANIVLERNHKRVGSGTGFLIESGLVTAHHVVHGPAYDTALIRFDDDGPDVGIRLAYTTLQQMTMFRSEEDQLDLAILALNEPELDGRYRFSLNVTVPPVGTSVVVMGYPYSAPHLSSHVGYISAAYLKGTTQYVQLDASVNPSNSGGPVMDASTSEVVGYVTRAQTGLTDDFEMLIAAFRSNLQGLQRQGGGISIGGVDPVQGLAATMASMERLAVNMKRSANVGIGYAFGAQHISENLWA
jgi:S1-C subfamily serine protease